ncbi:TetR/AcrR family transcriptional regulator [Brevundimonas sp.]|uniref:TetR/AcrR family transcriptional regulator n=1 Tax=Brevundimonas sp. TaxID=1871086 RepID=UPI001A2CF038|nr:TetR/AcrR family transcriptional regulator [Brevundimonas sp.]MBJ7483172.1 TetR/AcrR family transcriptional regulator [Brevundimonas sp.]
MVEAAMRILDRSPGSQLSLRTVAKEAGVAAPSLYRQFDDASAMLSEVERECWRQLGLEMSAAAEQVQEEPPLSRLQEQLGAYVRYAMQRPSRYQLLFATQLSGDTDVDGPVRPAYRPVFETIESHALLGGKLPTADTASSAILTISLAHGRIALAHLAPARPGNSAPLVEGFIRETLGRLFAD